MKRYSITPKPYNDLFEENSQLKELINIHEATIVSRKDETEQLKDKLQEWKEYINQLKDMRSKLSKENKQLKDKLHRRNVQIADKANKLKTIYYQLKDEENTPLNLTQRERNILKILKG